MKTPSLFLPAPHNSSKPLNTRRTFLGGLATALTAALASTSAGRQPTGDAAESSAPTQSVKQNPLDEYPKPPFEKQRQEWPGLASKMTPPPDHGEKTYQGTGR